MRKFILAFMAVAMLAIPASASADVPRCEAAPATPATATFTATQPYGAVDQWDNLWTHNYTVTVNPDRSFSGDGAVSGPGGVDAFPEKITGTFNSDGTISYVATRTVNTDVSYYTMTNGVTDGVTENHPLSTPGASWELDMKVTPPVFTAATTDSLNHGQYVKSQGGGAVAGKACKGMPLNSTQGK